MQHWRKFGVLIPLLALLCFGTNVRAQEDDQSSDDVIRAAFYLAAGDALWANNYINGVTKRLDDLNIEVVFSEFQIPSPVTRELRPLLDMRIPWA